MKSMLSMSSLVSVILLLVLIAEFSVAGEWIRLKSKNGWLLNMKYDIFKFILKRVKVEIKCIRAKLHF